MENNGFSKSPNVFSSPIDPPLLIMNIDIGTGDPEQLILRKNDNLVQTALEFCVRFHLNQDLAEILIQSMEENLRNTQINENSDTSVNYERPKSLADIYNDQKQQHCDNLFFQPKKTSPNQIFTSPGEIRTKSCHILSFHEKKKCKF